MSTGRKLFPKQVYIAYSVITISASSNLRSNLETLRQVIKIVTSFTILSNKTIIANDFTAAATATIPLKTNPRLGNATIHHYDSTIVIYDESSVVFLLDRILKTRFSVIYPSLENHLLLPYSPLPSSVTLYIAYIFTDIKSKLLYIVMFILVLHFNFI